MENASKALLMAGGMLITIIIVGVLMMAWNNMRELPKTQEQIKEAEELSAFNKKYESYAKNGIRGSDLVTLINMANNNNNKYENQADMQITVKFTITKALNEVVRTYKKENHSEKWNQQGNPEYGGDIKGTYSNSNLDGRIKNFFQDISDNNSKNVVYYSLSKLGLNSATQRTNSSTEIIKWANEAEQDVYYTKDNIGAEFRRKKFDLVSNGIQYNPTTGRINYIEFTEQQN